MTSVRAAIGSKAGGGLAPGYKLWLPCQDGSGTTIADRSGNSADATIGASAAAGAWANAGYFTSASNASFSAAHGATVPNAGVTVDWRTKRWLLSMRVRGSAPAGVNFFGSGGDGDSAGFRIIGNAGGSIQIAINRGSQLGLGNSAATNVFDGNEHTLTFYYDGPSHTMWQFVDGVPDANSEAEGTTGAGSGSGIFSGVLGIGHATDTTGAVPELQFRDIHLIQFDAEPANVLRLVKLLHGRPLVPLTANDVADPRTIIRPLTRRVVCLVGQSNERGNSENTSNVGVSFAGAFGPPTIDPIQPNGDAVSPGGGGAYGSPWPRLVSRLWAEARTSLVVKNSAVGGTSILDWTGDTAGEPLAEGDVGFDPNSYISGAYGQIQNHGGEKWMFLSLGQNDASSNTDRGVYARGIISACNYFLDRDVKVAIGFTGYGGSAANWYRERGNQGVSEALAYFKGNPNVIRGANLFEAYGITLAQGPVGGHFAPSAYRDWSNLWFDALVAAGW